MNARNKIIITDQLLIIEPIGLDKLWSLTNKIEIPLAHIKGATFDPGIKHEAKGIRKFGLKCSSSKLSGTFQHNGEQTFYNVSGFENAIVIQLDGNKKYTRLVLSTDNPNHIVNEINSKI